MCYDGLGLLMQIAWTDSLPLIKRDYSPLHTLVPCVLTHGWEPDGPKCSHTNLEETPFSWINHKAGSRGLAGAEETPTIAQAFCSWDNSGHTGLLWNGKFLLWRIIFASHCTSMTFTSISYLSNCTCNTSTHRLFPLFYWSTSPRF